MSRYLFWIVLIFTSFSNEMRADVLARWDFQHWEPEAGFPIPAQGGAQESEAKLSTTFHPEGIAKSGKSSLRLNRGIPGKSKENENRALEFAFTLPEAGPLYLVCRLQRSQSGFLHQLWSYSMEAGEWIALPEGAAGEIPSEWGVCKLDLSRLVEAGGGGKAHLRVAFSGGTGGGGSNVLIESIEIRSSAESAQDRLGVVSEAAALDSSEVALGIRGIGGVYFLAEKGELLVDVRRRNGSGRMRAILSSPNREVLGTVELGEPVAKEGERPDRSGWSKKSLKATVALPGVYRLEVFSPGDREGRGLTWGFSTNARHYMVDSSISQGRIGSKLPVSLNHAEHPAAFVFRAPDREFDIALSGLASGVQAVQVEAPQQELRLPVAKGEVKQRLTLSKAAEPQSSLVVLRWPSQKGSVAVEGLTYWDGPRDGYYPKLPLWTDSPAAFFDIDYHRWALFPYNTTCYTPPGEKGKARFTVRNGSPERAVFYLALNGADLEKWEAVLDRELVTLEPGESTFVDVYYRTPLKMTEKSWLAYLSLKVASGSGEFETYSSFRVYHAQPQHEATAPIVLRPYQHESCLYGYSPEYPLNEVAFDRANRPMIRERDVDGEQSKGVFRWDGESWQLQPFVQSETLASRVTMGAGARLPTKISFDEKNRAYTLLACRGRSGKETENYLVAMADAESVVAYPLDRGSGVTFEMEQFTGHNEQAGPPPLLCSTLMQKGDRVRWKYVYRMELILPRESNEGIVFDERVLVSDQSIGVSSHSGGSAQIVSDGDLVHLVWGEVSPEESGDPGVPTYAATYNRKSRTLGEKVLIGYGPPVNDIHNSPAMVMDSEGYLHALTGAHGHSFQYARSRKPHSTVDGWSEPLDVIVDERGRVGGGTYIGLVCDPNDTLHLVYRENRSGDAAYFDGERYQALSYQRKRKGQGWEEPRLLVVPPLPDYSVYYHRLSLNRKGRLFLSYSYRSAYRTYRSDTPGFVNFPALLSSVDAGETWRLASNQDLVAE